MTPTLHPIPLHYHLTPTPPVLFPKELEKVNRKKREQKMKEKKDKIRKEIYNGKK
jgi:hypothetical protein